MIISLQGHRLAALSLAFALPIGACDDNGNSASDGGGSHTDGSVDGSDDMDGMVACEQPVALEFRLDNGASSTKAGFTGVHFANALAGGAVFGVAIDDCDEDCTSNCTFHGPIRVPASAPFQRCSGDPATLCESDEDCGVSKCLFYAGPSATETLFNGMADMCAVTSFGLATDETPWAVTGKIDLATGALLFDHFIVEGRAAIDHCPTCEGDIVALDGEPDGNCVGSLETYACDTQGTYLYPPTGEGTPEPSSLDCLVSGLDYDESLGQSRDFGGASTADITLTLDANSPDCGDGGGKCWCGVCSGAPTQTCFSDTDCGSNAPCGSGYGDTAPTRYDGCLRTEEGETECDFETNQCEFYPGGVTVECGLTDGVPEDSVSLDGSGVATAEGVRSTVVFADCTTPTGDALTDRFYGAPGLARYSFAFDVRPLSEDDL